MLEHESIPYETGASPKQQESPSGFLTSVIEKKCSDLNTEEQKKLFQQAKKIIENTSRKIIQSNRSIYIQRILDLKNKLFPRSTIIDHSKQ
jgi:hypothetical protein